MSMTLMTLMAMHYLNVPYVWGKQNSLATDCSGLVGMVLHDIGLTLADMTAQGYHDWCASIESSVSENGLCDSLVFFGENIKNVTHVGISVGMVDGHWIMINASGAGKNSLTMSNEELAQRNARVKFQRVDSRGDLIAAYVVPYRGKL